MLVKKSVKPVFKYYSGFLPVLSVNVEQFFAFPDVVILLVLTVYMFTF